MPYDYIEEYQKQNDSTIYKFLASVLKENNNILSGIEDKQPYLYRATNKPEGAIEYVQEKLIGASAAVNQLVKNGNFTTAPTVKGNNATITISNGEATLTPVDSSFAGNRWFQFSDKVPINTSHKMLFIYEYKYNIAEGSSTYFALKSGVFNNFRIDTLTVHNTSWTKVIKFIEFGTNVTVDDISFGYTFDGADSTSIRKVQIIDLTQMFGTSIADTAYTKEQTSAGSGIAWLKSYGFFTKDYYPYNTGVLQSVKTGSKKVVGKNLIKVDESALLNKQNCSIIYTDSGVQIIASGTYARSGYIFKVKEGSTYTIKFTGISTGSMNQVYVGNISDWNNSYGGVTLSSTSINWSKTIAANSNILFIGFYVTNNNGTTGTMTITEFQLELGSAATDYEPYTSTTYPLDSDLELRGLYKLDTNNNIVCDGDEYTSDGSVKRRYGISILDGSQSGTWQFDTIETTAVVYKNPGNTDILLPNHAAPSANTIKADFICNKYFVTTSRDEICPNGVCIQSSSYSVLMFGLPSDTAITTSAEFNTWLSNNPITVIYELATPITDEAASYQNPQIIHENGTEEFIDTRDYPLPVGHDTGYFTASDEKFFLPPVVDNDGRFLYHDGDGFQFKNFNQVASKVESSETNGNIKINGTETQVYDDSEIKGELTNLGLSVVDGKLCQTYNT